MTKDSKPGTASQALQALDCMLVACGPSPKMGDGTPCYDLIRTVLTSLPSPPVSGEAVTQLLATALDGLMRLYDDVDEGDKTAPEFVAACAALRQFRGFSPLTSEPVGQFDTSDYVIVGLDGRPRRNEPVADHIPDASKMVEPVGVTLPRDLAVLAQNVLFRNGFVSADDIEKAIKEYDARLSAAIGEPRRAALEGET